MFSAVVPGRRAPRRPVHAERCRHVLRAQPLDGLDGAVVERVGRDRHPDAASPRRPGSAVDLGRPKSGRRARAAARSRSTAARPRRVAERRRRRSSAGSAPAGRERALEREEALLRAGSSGSVLIPAAPMFIPSSGEREHEQQGDARREAERRAAHHARARSAPQKRLSARRCRSIDARATARGAG